MQQLLATLVKLNHCKMRFLALLFVFVLSGCVSTKSTIKNIDDSAKKPSIQNGAFVLTEYASDSKYGYDADYPINIGLILERQEESYVRYFFNALQGPKGETITYEKIDTCCPFPTKHNSMGAGTLSIYEVHFEGSSSTKKLYFNSYEKGKIVCPKGFSIKPLNNSDN